MMRVAAGLLTLVAAAGLASFVTNVSSDNGPSRRPPRLTPYRTPETLSICIQSVTPVNTVVLSRVMDRIADGIERFGTSADRYRNAQAVIGCPPMGSRTSGNVVEEPSPHRLHVFVSDRVSRPGYEEWPEEMLCDGDVCGDVTTGVRIWKYDEATLFEAIVGGLGVSDAIIPTDYPRQTPR